MIVAMKINTDDFNKRVEIFNQKAYELSELAHELSQYDFSTCIERVMSDEADTYQGALEREVRKDHVNE